MEDNRRAVFWAPGRPSVCDKCGGKYKYKAQGIYECEDCRNVMLDDYGKVRVFLETNGNAPAIVISAETGVPVSVIQEYLKDGKLEIPDGSDIYIKCEKCGKDIRYGKYCPSCATQLSKDLQGALHMGNIGEVPKVNKSTGKMRYFEKDGRR